MNWNSLSTKDNPIGFFEYFLKEGYSIFYRNFFGLNYGNSTLFAPEETLNVKTENFEVGIWTITEQELSGGSTGEFVLFDSELNELLKEQINKSLEIINSQVLNHINKEQLHHYLTTLAARLQELLENNKDSDIISKHPIIFLNLKSLFNTIYIQSNKSINIPEILKSFHAVLNTNISLPINSFQMKPRYFERIGILYEALLNSGLIDTRTSIEDFKQTFSGRDSLSSNKIIWTGMGKNKQFSKFSIFYFVRSLENKHIIEITRNEKVLKNLILKSFLDNEGNSIKEISVSFSAFKKAASTSRNLIKMEEIVSTILH